MSLAKLTAVSTKTLSLLLERQRLQTLPSFTPDTNNGDSSSSGLHFVQIKRNLKQLHSGILELEAKDGSSAEAAKLLRNQYDRMRGMLTVDEQHEIPKFEPRIPLPSSISEPRRTDFNSSTNARDSLLSQPSFAPYTDDPEQGYGVEPPEPETMLQTQRLMMDEQDSRLDELSNSISRQHHLSLQINEELDVHHGLLQELDTGIDRTQGRINKARRKLDRVAQGVKNNASVVTIGVIIFILLILIIRFKT